MMNTLSKKILSALLSTMVLSSCNNPQSETSTIEDPKVSGNSIRFPAKSPMLKHLLLTSVIEAQRNSILLPGRVVWDEDHTSHISPTIAGRFVSIKGAGELGATVKENEPLAYLLSPELATAQTEMVNARAAQEQAEKNYTRINELIADKGASTKDLEEAKVDLERAHAEFSRADLHSKLLGVNTGDVDQRFTVRSPVSGVVVERNTSAGLEWKPDQSISLFTVSDPTFMWCKIDAPEYLLDKLHTGMKVSLSSNAWPMEHTEATIDYIGDTVDTATRTVKIRAHLRNMNRHLKNEMYVSATITSDPQGTFDIPAKAVFLNHNEQQIFIRTADGLFVRKKIIPVSSNEQWISINQGTDKQDLKKDDKIVVDGALYLEKILEDATTQAASDKPKS